MTTFTSNQASASQDAGPGIGWHNLLMPVYGEINVTANPADGDIYKMCYLPANFLLFSGQFTAADLDASSPSTLDLDLGWASNGGSSETYQSEDGTEYTNAAGTADPDGLLNMGVLTGDPVSSVTTANGTWRPIVLARPLFFSRATLIQVEANAASSSLASGYMSVILFGKKIG